MSYSFIKPKIKPLFSIFTKIWLWAMIILSILSIFWAIFLGAKIYIVNSNSQDLQAQYDEKNDEFSEKMVDNETP